MIWLKISREHKYIWQNLRFNFSRLRVVLDIDVEEIKALFDLLYMAGVLKSRHTNLNDLCNDDAMSPELFRMVMSKNRFYLLLRALRFDDITSRVQRKTVDKLDPIRDFCKEMPSLLLTSAKLYNWWKMGGFPRTL